MKCIDCGANLTHVKKKKVLLTLYVCRVCGKMDSDYKKINDHEGECIEKLKRELLKFKRK